MGGLGDRSVARVIKLGEMDVSVLAFGPFDGRVEYLAELHQGGAGRSGGRAQLPHAVEKGRIRRKAEHGWSLVRSGRFGELRLRLFHKEGDLKRFQKGSAAGSWTAGEGMRRDVPGELPRDPEAGDPASPSSSQGAGLGERLRRDFGHLLRGALVVTDVTEPGVAEVARLRRVDGPTWLPQPQLQ